LGRAATTRHAFVKGQAPRPSARHLRRCAVRVVSPRVGIERSFIGDSSMPPAERAALMARSINIAMAASIIQIACVVASIVGPPVYLCCSARKRSTRAAMQSLIDSRALPFREDEPEFATKIATCTGRGPVSETCGLRPPCLVGLWVAEPRRHK